MLLSKHYTIEKHSTNSSSGNNDKDNINYNVLDISYEW